MDESKPMFSNWPFKGSPISSTSSGSSSTSTGQPVLPTEQTKLPVKQRVVFPSDRTITSFGNYNDNMNNNKGNKIFPTYHNRNKNNDVKIKKNHNMDDKQEFRDGWEFDSQHYRNPSPPISERICKNDNNQRRRQDYSNRCNDRRNYNNNYNHTNNQRGKGFISYAKSNNKSNGDNMPGKRRRNDSVETDDAFYIDWSDCNATTTNRSFSMTTAATQTSPKVQHQATQSNHDCNTPNPGPKKTTKDAILIDSWVKSLIGNSISFNRENGQSNTNVFSAASRNASHFVNDNSIQSCAPVDNETQDNWAAEFKNKAQVGSPQMDKLSGFSRLGKPAICESNNFIASRSDCQPVKPSEKIHPTPLFNETRVNPNLQKSQLTQEISPSNQIMQPQKPQHEPTTSLQSQKPAEINIRDPRIRKRLSIDAIAAESSMPKRQINEVQSLDSIPLIPLIPLEPVKKVHPSCSKIDEKKPIFIDLS